jgi:hypothetical protein
MKKQNKSKASQLILDKDGVQKPTLQED